MSHELRTPLNAVLGFAQLLEIESTLTADQHESVTQIVKGGRHLLELINEVLDIARIETGNLGLSAEPVLPGDVVSDVIDLVRPLAVERSISIATNLRMGDAYVLADRQRLRQVLLNLLSNAVKYNHIGGTITVECDQIDASHVRISVTDTGDGISADHHEKLFQPFERLGAEQTNIEGTGVGLALSRRLADAMGATLDFESTVGQGSTFWIELPVVEGPVERIERLTPLTSVATGSQAPRHTVLYIEDNLANVKLIEHVFAARGNVDVVAAMQGRLGTRPGPSRPSDARAPRPPPPRHRRADGAPTPARRPRHRVAPRRGAERRRDRAADRAPPGRRRDRVRDEADRGRGVPARRRRAAAGGGACSGTEHLRLIRPTPRQSR